ncbi:cytochrome P450 [Streptomyces sp. NPDC017529]|uniref:cytochrome P450 n=1 Tax=Streptomyces sp. NPDC017529 TaxID=3365000 RepID=UPI0037A0888B
MTKPEPSSPRRRRSGPKPADVPAYQRRDVLDPLPELSLMSVRTPLVEAPGTGGHDWIATGREEVRAVLGDAERFSTGPPAASAEESRRLVQPGNLLQYDLPEHARLRKMLTPEFTVRRMRRMEPVIEEAVADQLDDLESAGPPADLMRHFAWPVPGLVICGLLGVPRDDLADLARVLDIRATSRTNKREVAAKTVDTYLVKIVARKRAEPGDDLLSMLVREHGTDVTDQELAGICSSFIAAALEGSAQMLGLGTLALLLHPGQLTLLRERPELMDRAVEELLRYVAVVSLASPRTALVDVPLAGRVVKAGQVVTCSLLAANRAEMPGAPRDTLDITRENTTHLAFGHGIHHCVGASLARMALRTAFARLLERFPGLRLAAAPHELRFRQLAPQYGVETLPVAW